MRKYGEVMAEAAERQIAAWPRGERFAVLPSMQAVTLEVIMRAVFGFEDAERRERIGDPLRRLLDTVASRPRVLALALTVNRNGPRSPWARFAADPRGGRRAALRGDRAPAAPTRTALTATTSSRCCSPRATRTATRSATPSCATS